MLAQAGAFTPPGFRCYRFAGDRDNGRIATRERENRSVIALLVSLVCVFGNAFFVGAEFALAKVRPTALEALAKGGDRSAQRALEIQNKLDQYLSATQLGITLASLGLGWLGEPAIAEILEHGFESLGVVAPGVAIPAWVHGIAATIALSIISFAHIVIGELVPKSLAIQRPELLARLSSRPLKTFFIVMYPALWLLNQASKLVLRMLRLPEMEHAEGKLSLEELRLLIQASLSERGIEGTKRELLERVLRATDRPVRAVMVPRVDMQILSLSDDIESCMQRVRSFGFSRYPLAEDGDPDRIVGYVYVKDVLMASRRHREGGKIGDLKRDILYVPESRTVGQLLTEFQASKIPMALVVDEYGGTSGLVTLEDVVAEIVGDIRDELHLDEPRMRILPDGSVVVDGSLPMGELALDGLLAPEIEGAETVSGYVLATLGRLAHPGDRVRLGRYEALVEDVRERRVHRVSFRPLTDADIEAYDAMPRSVPPSAGH
jgi:CBS domain containing-hemolysin-like protein